MADYNSRIDDLLDRIAEIESNNQPAMTNKELANIVLTRLEDRLEDIGLSDLLQEITMDVLEEYADNHMKTDEDYEQAMDVASRIYLAAQ